MHEEEFPIEPYGSGNCNAPELARITKSWNVDPPRNPTYRIILTMFDNSKGFDYQHYHIYSFFIRYKIKMTGT
jgi:hypothetical protein